MGIYLNSTNGYTLFLRERRSKYYVDKTGLLADLVNRVEPDVEDSSLDTDIDSKYVAITRPRRFGKTVTANMISAYFGKGTDSHKAFDGLQVSNRSWYKKHLNRHNVIHISFNKTPKNCKTYEQYISRFEKRLLFDLTTAYPDAGITEDLAVWDALENVFACYGKQFIFVLDEWDYIFHQDFAAERDRGLFTDFLSKLLKDNGYVEMAYLTGILPISKYSSGSELNMFAEYTMVTEARYSEYFGFTEREVDDLYARYVKEQQGSSRVTREGLKEWYDGYHTLSGERMYNPRSVILALRNNNLGDYWTTSGPYEEAFSYVSANVDAVKDDIGLLISGIPVPALVQEYAASSKELKTKDEIFSAMVVYGLLNYENGCVSIPNRELMGQFANMARKEPSLGSIYRLASESERMLAATKAMDTQTMEEIIQFVHHTESPLLVYNSEAELTAVVSLAYLKARDYYRIEREDKAGIGYADFIFYPIRRDDDVIIIEIKVNQTPETAIRQIKDRQYALKFEGKLGQSAVYTGRILAVGIAYQKDKEKKHACRVEILRERLSMRP